MRSREVKLDFAITYNIEEAEVEGYVDRITCDFLHDDGRVGFAIGDSLWEDIQYAPRPKPKPDNPSKGKIQNCADASGRQGGNEECAPIGEGK
jgi:hypothetical protein